MTQLQEVLPLRQLRSLPAAEPSLVGFMSLREHVLPVFDPASIAGLGSVPPIQSVNAIVLSLEGKPTFALIAETVGHMVSLPSPSPLSLPARMPAAFGGEIPPGSHSAERLLILDVVAFAVMMGLSPNPSSKDLDGEVAAAVPRPNPGSRKTFN